MKKKHFDFQEEEQINFREKIRAALDICKTFNSEGNEVTPLLLKATHKYACTYAHSEEDKK